MATFQNTVTIRRAIEDVFAFLADFENVPTWNYAIVETKKTSPGPVGMGTTYRQLRSIPDGSEEGFEVTAFEPSSRLEVHGNIGHFIATISYLLTPTGEGTAWPMSWTSSLPQVYCDCWLPSPPPGSRRRWQPTSTRSSRSWKPDSRHDTG
jgi:hypothetical protein